MQFKQNVGIDRYNLLVRYSNAGQGSFYMSAPGHYCKVNYELLDHQLTKPIVYLDQMTTTAVSVSLSDSLPGLFVIKPGVEYFPLNSDVWIMPIRTTTNLRINWSTETKNGIMSSTKGLLILPMCLLENIAFE